ncbi:unnamed protein product [Rotaria sordida]|uniref:Uncharacterized protein n=1 Tax=Rotaria sordida TaxID=392033 RepID=A0A814J0G7_9BILA|nr:unnamed protein product [Rotaria sordida]CAF1038180.1 unnamed protein product [Rotaria sordida]CAF3613642.1 unnamed protein product [Rotaria sordida]CAF3738558.1 unnamed protein product [Rotaria sordida]
MLVLLLFVILIDSLSSIEIKQSPKQFKIQENSPNGTIIGTIQTNPSNYLMNLIDDANGRFRLNSIGQLIVSTFIYTFLFSKS